MKNYGDLGGCYPSNEGMVQQNFSAVLLFNGKVGDVNTYSVILVTNSYGESWDSSCEKY